MEENLGVLKYFFNLYFLKIHSNVFFFLILFKMSLKKINAIEKKTAINQNKDCPNTPVYPFFLVSVLPDLYSVNHKASDNSWSPMQYSLCTLRAPMISIHMECQLGHCLYIVLLVHKLIM